MGPGPAYGGAAPRRRRRIIIGLLAIDPGKTGAIAALDLNLGYLEIQPLRAECPEALYGQLASLISDGTVVYSEDVGYGRPGSNVRSVTTFARHCGMLEGFLAILPGRVELVSPQRWMRQVVPERPTGVESSASRKLHIMESCKEWLERSGYVTDADITLAVSDAIGILRYGLLVEGL